MKIVILCYYLLLTACSESLIPSDIQEIIGVRAILFIDSNRTISLMNTEEKYIDNRINNWQIKLLSHNDSIDYLFNPFASTSDYYIEHNIFIKSSGNLGNSQKSVYLANRNLQFDSLSQYAKCIINDGQNTYKFNEKIAPKIHLLSVTRNNNLINYNIKLPAGDYSAELKVFMSSQSTARVFYLNQSRIERDTTLIGKLDPDINLNFVSTAEAWSYSIEFYIYIHKIASTINYGDNIRLYEVLGDDASKYENFMGNVQPYEGYFVIINRDVLSINLTKD